MYFRNIATYEWIVHNGKMETPNTVNCGDYNHTFSTSEINCGLGSTLTSARFYTN